MNSNWLNSSCGRGRLGTLLLMAVLASVFGSVVHAANVNYGVSGNGTWNPSNTGTDLSTAIGDINTAVENGRGGGVPQYSASATVNINANETATGAGGTYGHWVLDGASNPNDYTQPLNGFNTVAIDGGGAAGGQAVLNGNGTNMALKVYHVANQIDVSNIKVTNGVFNLTGTLGGSYHGEVGGAGMTLGGNGMVATHMGPARVLLNNVAAEGNKITIVSAGGVNNAFGGGILVNGHGVNGAGVSGNRSDVQFTDVNLINNSIDFTQTDSTGGSIRGGGARVGYAEKFAYTNGLVERNSVVLTNGDHAAGGGLSVDGGDQYANVTLSNVNFLSNSVTIKGSRGVGQDAVGRGGAFYYLGNKTGAATAILFNNGTSFTDNRVEAYAVGSPGDIIAYGGAVHIMTDNAVATFDGVSFTNNEAWSQDTAMGGAVMAETYLTHTGGKLDIKNNSVFTGNKATGVGIGYGGAVAALDDTGDHSFSDSRFDQNSATSSGSNGYALGGAVFLGEGNHDFTNVAFDRNNASATGISSVVGGGAVYLDKGTHSVANSTFNGNQASVTGSNGWALGGAMDIAEGGVTTISGSEFTGNTTRSTDYSMGGAIYLWGGVLNVEDTAFTNNQATSTDISHAKGGAIYVATNETSASPVTLNLSATAGKETLISGNRAGGYASGIHIGNDNGGISRADALLNISGPGKVSILDPITVSMNNLKNFNLKKTGTGEFAWDGTNTFTTTGGSSYIDLDGGKVILGDKFTAKGVDSLGNLGGFDVHVGSTTTVEFSISRDQSLAMFDFASNNGTKNFVVDNGATLTTNLGREIVSQTWKFAVATGASDAQLQLAKNNFTFTQTGSYSNILGLQVEGNTLYAMVNFQSPFDTSGVNPKSALGALDSLLKANGGTVVSDAEYNAILSNPYASTPELYMDQSHIMVNTVDMVARTAVEYGAKVPYRQRMHMQSAYPMATGAYGTYESYSEDEYYEDEGGYYEAYPSLAYCNNDSGARIWGGYVGNLHRRDTSGGYQGYKVETHGFVLGANYDFSANGTIGVYGGYTSGESKARVSSSKVESDVGHLGLIARMSPLTEVPQFSIYADGGYHFSYNDFHREVGGFRNEGSFDQDLWTGGIGLEYVWNLGCNTITPHFEARYVNLDQHALRESGNSALATNVEGIGKGSFNTRLGVEFSRDFQLACGIVTPSLNVSWKHEYGKQQYWSNAYYVRDPSPINFNMSASSIDRDSADIGFALRSLYVTGSQAKVGFNVSYNLSVSRRSNVHSLYAGFDIGF